MLYMEYEALKDAYLESQRLLNAVVDEKERLFSMTQPKSTRYDKERVNGGEFGNQFEKYIILKEQRHLDERIAEAEALMHSRKSIMMVKEEELRASKDIIDVIYVFRCLDHRKVSKIAKKVGYSKSQVYRIIEKIDHDVKMRQNATKGMIKL